MALRIFPDAMREAWILTPRAAADLSHLQLATRRSDGIRHTQSWLPRRRRPRDPCDRATDTRGDRLAIGDAELVAARPDRRAEHGIDDGFGERRDRSLDHAGREPAPTGVHDRELCPLTDQHHRRAIANPASEHHIVEIGQSNVTLVSIAGTGHVDPNRRRAMDLVELGPWKIDKPPATRLEYIEGHLGAIEVAVGTRRTLDAHDPPTGLGDRDSCGADAVT